MIAVVIPCYRTRGRILDVLSRIDANVARIYVVDDACPEGTGDLVEASHADDRVRVLRHERNRGVGAAVVTGYRAALADGAQIVVKIDGDGQMDPAQLSRLVAPIAMGTADYAKGNRFYDFALLQDMPRVRLLGNALLSLVNKISSGYWNVMDPTNGYTAIHRVALEALPLGKIDNGYFFESDMLFRLYTVRAVVRDVPLRARYAGESSNLRIGRVLRDFPGKYVSATLKRIFYSYFLRDFNAGTLQLASGLLLLSLGTAYGVTKWINSSVSGFPTTSGAVMLAALPVLVGVQLLLGALQFDIQNVPRTPLCAEPALAGDTQAG
ncbi:MAG TPA: glycosyltransferase family 2 protein [Casimicrobiaceae bacterium]|nr:glycosyltransferase family 2 protein [Casimicrobiaceae bacterium]